MNVVKTTNEHGIEMLEIKPKTKKGRSQFISLKKARAIIKASETETAWIEVVKYGRPLREVNWGIEGKKSFLVGDVKLDAVLSSIKEIQALGVTAKPKTAKKKATKKAKVVKQAS